MYEACILWEFHPHLTVSICLHKQTPARVSTRCQLGNLEDKWELDAVMKIVERKIDARERAAATSCPSGKKQCRELPMAATLMSTDSSPSCAYCDQAHHHSSQCRAVTDVKLRKGMLMKAERCFLCMKKGNLSKTCRALIVTCHR